MSRNKKNQVKKSRSLTIEHLSDRVMLDAGGLIDPVFIGATPYLSEADLPAGFVPVPGCEDCTYEIETFEDGTLDHGLILSNGQVVGPEFSTGIERLTDSVDGDDGAIDGTGNSGEGGYAYFTFDDSITVTLPSLMQSAGLVWTDGDPILTDVVFEAFDQNGESLGTVHAGAIADNEFTGQTAEDRFFGVTYGDGVTTGITRITITNIQEGSGIEIDHIQFANCAACCDQIDLELTKTVDAEFVFDGDTVNWTIEVTNNADAMSDATGVQVGDLLPTGLLLEGVSLSDGSFSVPTGTWTLSDPLAPGDSETITITTTLDTGLQGGAMIENVAQVIAADQEDIDSTPNNDDGDQSEDDEDSAKITLRSVIDLELTKTVDATIVDDGDTVNWTIEITNNGDNANADATGVQVADLLPAGMLIEGVAVSNGSFSIPTGVWTLSDSLSPGETESITLTTTLDTGLSGGEMIFNVAQVIAADQIDIDSIPNNDNGDQSEDDEDNAKLTIGSVIDLELVKTVDASIVEGGQTVTWTIELTNNAENANAAATGVQVLDLLPGGLTLVDATPSGNGTFADLTWNLVDPLAPGAAETLTIVTSVSEGLGGGSMIVNTAYVSAANETDIDSTPNNDDPNEDDQDTAKVTVANLIDLQVTKSVDQTIVAGGDSVNWTISVTNTTGATAEATGVQLADVLPSGLTLTGSNASDGTYDAVNNIWILSSSLAIGETETLTLTTVVDTGLPGGTMLENTVQVISANQFDLDSTPNNDDGDQSEDDEATAKVTVQEVIDLEVTKVVDSTVVQAGDTVTWTITLTNNPTTANAAATGVVVLDALPTGVTLANATPSGDSTFVNEQWLINEPVAPGQQFTLTLETTVDADFVGSSISNVTQVVAAGQTDIDSNPNNDDGDQSEDDEANAQITVQVPVDMIMLSGFSYVDTNDDGIFQSYELPLMGVEVNLMGTDDAGNVVNLTTFTNRDGFYKFNDLNSGTYMVKQTQPVQFIDGKDTVGNLGGSIAANDKINVTLNGNGENYNFGELGLRPEFVNKRLYLTSTPYTAWEFVDVRQASIWYSFDAAHQSFLEINGQTPIGNAEFTVLDADMNVVGSGEVLSLMADPIPLQPGEYYIEFSGESLIHNLSVDLTTPNVRVSENSVVAVATAGDDLVELQLGSETHVLNISGLEYYYDANLIDTFYIGGATGDDHVVVHGTYLDDTGRVLGMRGDLESAEYEVHTYSFEDTSLHGGGGEDVAKLFGSLGSDNLQSLPSDTTLTTPENVFHVVNFGRVDAFGRGGDDVGSLYGTYGDDLFISRDEFTVLVGEGHFVKTKGFERINALGRGGNDVAKLHDTAGDDRFISTEEYAGIVTSKRDTFARGFEEVDALSSNGGVDSAYLLHLASVDSFYAANDIASLDRDNRDDEAKGFGKVVVAANAGANPTGVILSNLDYALVEDVDWA